MTAIAYKAGILAADTGTFVGYTLYGRRRKIIRNSDGFLAASAGDSGACEAFAEWFMGRMEGRFDPLCVGDKDSFAALIILGVDTVKRVDSKGRVFETRAAFHAEGACEELLLGAMAAGASAQEAVRLAIEYSTLAGGEVQVEHLMEV